MILKLYTDTDFIKKYWVLVPIKMEVKALKKTIFVLIIILIFAAIAGCSAKEPDTQMQETGGSASTESVDTNANESESSESTDPQLPEFNAEELAKYNGLDGNPAYVAYEGYVYDVSDIKAWKDGIHQGKHKAGFDYTEVLNNQAPHSPKNLTDNAPIVGIYNENK